MQIKTRLIAAAVSAFFSISALGGCGLITETVESIQGDLFEKTRFEDDADYTAVSSAKSVDSENYEGNPSITHGFDSLYTDNQRTCYELIGEAAYRISEEKDESGFYPIGKVSIADKSFAEKDMDICIKAFTMDHPEVFWLTNRYTYGTAGNQSVLQLYSYVSGEECSSMIDVFNDAVNRLISGIPGGLKQYHLEKYVHNSLLEGCTYAKGVESSDDGWAEFTSYGAIVNGSAVCEGYAHAMCLILNKVGIDCYYANGYGEDSPHMWNIVKINDNWYHLDATWDDNENAYYNYFNLSDERIEKDHIIEPSINELADAEKMPPVYNLFLPECTEENANYFVIESTYISDFEESRDVMVSDLINAANNGDDMFTVRFDPDYSYDDCIKVMFNEEPYYMFDYIGEANESLDSTRQINNENLAIIMIETFNAVVVKLEYNSSE